ncbi:hypothetical protein A249_12142, partial [Pseudomonas syringae pv. actinidiae ICMP 18804]
FLGIATPKPMAVQEQRFLGLRSKAWLVTEFIDGPDIIERRISHGDFKGHNLFWHTDRWAMIDLDAMQQHSSQSSFAAAYARDRARFMRNWPVESALH